MILMDYVVVAAIIGVTVAWWLRNEALGIALSTILTIAGIYAVVDHRWQAALGALLGIIVLAVLLLRVRNKPAKTSIPKISGTFTTLLGALGIFLIIQFPVNDLPAPSGKHAVGVRDFHVTDDSRPDLHGIKGPRPLPVRVWYPAGTTDGFERRHYFTETEARTTATGLGTVLGMPFLIQYAKHAMTNAYVDAPLIEGASDLPVVIYSHGYTSFIGQNTALMEELASHGYVVYSISHTGDSSPVVLDDGTLLSQDPALFEQVENMAGDGISQAWLDWFLGETFAIRLAGFNKHLGDSVTNGDRIVTLSVDVWRDDRIFVHDALAAGEVPDTVKPIAEAGNLSATGQMGMSFGGSTTGSVCLVDRRCAAGVNLDGGNFDMSVVNKQQPRPFMMFYGDYGIMLQQLGDGTEEAAAFNDFSYERHELAGLSKDVVRLKVNNVSHLGVSDFPYFASNPIKVPLYGDIPGETILQIQNDFVLGFFNKYVRGVESNFPSTEFAKHSNWVEPNSASPFREWWVSEHPEDTTMRVVIETSMGEIELALYPERAPVSAANFAAYVEGGHYNGATFYRVVKQNEEGTSIGVVQGGIFGAVMSGDTATPPEAPMPPIAHETTDDTGIPNERGTIAYARLAPGTAGSEFFFNVSDNTRLDAGPAEPPLDGLGYATFGRVVRGLDVLDAIQNLPADAETEIEMLQGQILGNQVTITNMTLVEE